jgi:riboflavin synthase
MFTGIIEEKGTILSVKRGIRSAVLKISAEKVLEGMKIGDSINTNGVCLTIVSFGQNGFSVDVMYETLKVTNLGSLKAGSKVNLERALSLNDRLGGHLVAGHIDGTGEISGLKRDDNAILINITSDESILRYLILKGSIAVDGISLTIAELYGDSFMVSVIPHTAAETTLGYKNNGDQVNLECDLIGKYVEKFLLKDSPVKKNEIGLDYLKEHGFLT